MECVHARLPRVGIGRGRGGRERDGDDEKGYARHRACELDVVPDRRSRFCRSTIAATSARSCFASYTMPSLIVYFTPPTRSTRPVWSFSFTAPVPYSTL